LIKELHDTLRSYIRRKAGKEESPGLGIIDSRSVKTSHRTNSVKGIDGGRKEKRRKQHIITDTVGLVLCVSVHSANIHDSRAAIQVIEKLRYKFSRMIKILADGGYRGELTDKVKSTFGWVLEVVLRSDKTSKFQVLSKRWIVKRTFARFENYRRLCLDYEFNNDTTEAMIHLATIKLMFNRELKNSKQFLNIIRNDIKFNKMEKTWRWFGKKDKIILPMLTQIGVKGIVTALHDIPNGAVWSPEAVTDMKQYIESFGLLCAGSLSFGIESVLNPSLAVCTGYLPGGGARCRKQIC
jgi:putative transposase